MDTWINQKGILIIYETNICLIENIHTLCKAIKIGLVDNFEESPNFAANDASMVLPLLNKGDHEREMPFYYFIGHLLILIIIIYLFIEKKIIMFKSIGQTPYFRHSMKNIGTPTFYCMVIPPGPSWVYT